MRALNILWFRFNGRVPSVHIVIIYLLILERTWSTTILVVEFLGHQAFVEALRVT